MSTLVILLHGDGFFVSILVALLCGKEEKFIFSYSGETTLWRRWFCLQLCRRRRRVLLLSCSACFVVEWKFFFFLTVASLQK